MDQSLEQRIKQLETQLREQQRLYGKQLKDGADLNLLLRTMLQVARPSSRKRSNTKGHETGSKKW